MVSPPAAIIVCTVWSSGRNCRPTGIATSTSAPVVLVKVRLSASPMKDPLPRTTTVTPGSCPAMAVRMSTASAAAAAPPMTGRRAPARASTTSRAAAAPEAVWRAVSTVCQRPASSPTNCPMPKNDRANPKSARPMRPITPAACTSTTPIPHAATPRAERRANVPFPRTRTRKCSPS